MNGATPFANPLFAPLQPWLSQLPPRPDSAALNTLLEAHPRLTASGQPLRFLPPREDGLGYEERIDLTGVVETRADNWHDFFNALAWLSFPQAKQRLSAAHMQRMRPAGECRGLGRDALTHFDECGIVVLSRQAELLDLLRDFAWKPLFVDRRSEVIADMRFIIFGHATYEQLLAPFRGLTAKAILHVTEDALIDCPIADLLPAVDALLAEDFSSQRYQRPRDFQPLPLLGIPGVLADNENPAYYEDTWQFRPGRRQKT